MKKYVKKILALFFTLIIMTGIGMNHMVFAQETAQKGDSADVPDYDVWVADVMLIGYEGGPSLYRKFRGLQDPVYAMLGEYLSENEPLVAGSAVWSMCFNSEYRNQFANEYKYIYEIILMEYLRYDTQNSIILDELESSELEFSTKLYDMLSYDLSENTADYLDKEMTVGEAVDFFENVKTIENLNIAISELKDGADTIQDLINMLSEYLALQQVKEERVSLLQLARDANAALGSENENSDFIEAVDEVLDAMRASDFEYIQGKSFDYLWNKGWDTAWSILEDKNPILLGVTGLDVCFDSTNGASNNLKLLLLYMVDLYIQQGMMRSVDIFLDDKNSINGRTFLDCFKGYVQFQMYGNEISEKWLEDYLDSGFLTNLIRKVFNSENVKTANDLISKAHLETKDRKTLLETIEKWPAIYQSKYGNTINDKADEKDDKTDKDEKDITRDVVLVLDHSGSMSGYPMEQTKEASIKFVDTVFEKDSRVAVVSYDDEAVINCGLTDNQQELETKINEIYEDGSTNMYAGLEQADLILKNSQADKKIIVLMSDGLPNEGVSDGGDYSAPLIRYAEEMKNRGYIIYTLGFFTDVYGYDLSYAQQLMEGIASPRLHYEVNSAEDLVFFFDDIANQIAGTEFVYIRIACPVDVTVSSGDETLSSKADSENTRTSFGALTYESIQDESENEEDDSGDSYFENYGADDLYGEAEPEDQAKILRLNMDKDYDVEIEGYGSGKMDYTVSFPDENGEYNDVREFPNIAVTASTKATSNTSASDATYLKVDEDGDGKIDTTYKTEANGKMEEVKDNKVLYIILIVLSVVIVLVVVLIAVLVHLSGKKKRASAGTGKPVGEIYGAFGIFRGQSYPMRPGQQCVVGRKSSCNIQLVHGEVSRTHCMIEMLPDGVYQVTDYSTNGTFYNDMRLKSGEPYRLPKGALLAIGDADNVLELK